MYTSFYSMSCNPFIKDESIKYKFESNDFNQAISRFNYLKEIKGIGLFIGQPGLGKTYTVRSFINTLNKDLYKVIYISANKDMTVFDFYKTISNNLNLDIGACYRNDIYMNIQKEIKRLVNQDKVQPVIIIDDAQVLSRDILLSFKVLYDFEMDSKDYITLILIGHPELKIELSKNIYEPLKQRIIVNYTFNGLTRLEVKEYIKTRLELANTTTIIFDDMAINALYSCCKSSPRRLNTLIINSLMLGYQNNCLTIDSDIVMDAKNEMDFMND
ncbi:MAG: AAA family ATPase [Roseburia sp.]|nr:AAA family ATPase [Roseburia sp.]